MAGRTLEGVICGIYTITTALWANGLIDSIQKEEYSSLALEVPVTLFFGALSFSTYNHLRRPEGTKNTFDELDTRR